MYIEHKYKDQSILCLVAKTKNRLDNIVLLIQSNKRYRTNAYSYSNNICNWKFKIKIKLCVCVCVCVWVRERKRMRESVCVCVTERVCVCSLLFNNIYEGMKFLYTMKLTGKLKRILV